VKAINHKNSTFFLLSILLLLGFSGVFFQFTHTSEAFVQTAYPAAQLKPINVTLTSTQALRVTTAATSNVSLLSVVGGQYDIGLYTSGGKNILLFTPLQNANYSLILNISSFGQNYAMLNKGGTPSDSWTKNITGTGTLIVSLAISVVPPPLSTQNSSWNPLFGFTGISLGGITLDATDVLVIFALFAVALVGIGAKYSQKMLYGGFFFLALLGMIAIGILVVGLIIGIYVAGFVVIRSLFGFRARRKNL